MVKVLGGFFGGGLVCVSIVVLIIGRQDPNFSDLVPMLPFFFIIGATICFLTFGAFKKKPQQSGLSYSLGYLKALMKGIGTYFAVGLWITFGLLSIVGPSAPRRAIGSWITSESDEDKENEQESKGFYWDNSNRVFRSSVSGKVIPIKSGEKPPTSHEDPEEAFIIDNFTHNMIRAN